MNMNWISQILPPETAAATLHTHSAISNFASVKTYKLTLIALLLAQQG